MAVETVPSKTAKTRTVSLMDNARILNSRKKDYTAPLPHALYLRINPIDSRIHYA